MMWLDGHWNRVRFVCFGVGCMGQGLHTQKEDASSTARVYLGFECQSYPLVLVCPGFSLCWEDTEEFEGLIPC